MCVCNIHPKNGDASHLVIRNGGDILGRSWEHPSRDDVAWGGSLMKEFGKIMQSSKSEWAIKYWGHIGEDDDQPWVIQDFFRTNPYEFILSMNRSETIKCR